MSEDKEKPAKEEPTTLAGLRQARSRPLAALPGSQFGLPFASPRPAVPAPSSRVWTVRALIAGVRQQLETTYPDLWVEGEISNCRPAASGHLYFTLKDGEAQLPVVLFRRQAQLLRFRPKDGLAVKVRGRISVYDARGQLQLIAETMEEQGAGALLRAFEDLKARLKAEGLFDSARKHPLPLFPRCIGVVSSPTGAAIHDIITVIGRRDHRLSLLLHPAAVQGPHCPATVAAAIRWFNTHAPAVDLILLARGGGSIEDLAGFNDESLARAIAASVLPVVSAIGHETDFTIADFVADLRAPTPSAAAEIITAAQHRIAERLTDLAHRLRRASQFKLMQSRQRYTRLSSSAVLLRLRDSISLRDQRLEDLRQRLDTASERSLRVAAQRLAALTSRLVLQNPSHRLLLSRRRLDSARRSLHQAAPRIASPAAGRANRLGRTAARLHALSPLAVLSRGYSITYGPAGTLLLSPEHLIPGQILRTRLRHGSLLSTFVTQDTQDP